MGKPREGGKWGSLAGLAGLTCEQRTNDVISCLPVQVISKGESVKLDVSAGDFVVFQKYAMAEVGAVCTGRGAGF